MLNGNMVLPSRKHKLLKMIVPFRGGKEIEVWNKKIERKGLIKRIEYNKRQVTPTLNDGWISGYIDAQGSFSINLPKRSTRFNTVFDLSQKHEKNLQLLSHIILLFGVLP